MIFPLPVILLIAWALAIGVVLVFVHGATKGPRPRP